MLMTKNAVGNLIARYKTVLQNCTLMNTFGSLAVATVLAGTMVLGSASGALADYLYYDGDVTPLNGTYTDTIVAGSKNATVSTTSLTINSGTYKMYEIFGGGHATTGETANVTGEASLVINSGDLQKEVYTGGYAVGDGATANVGSTSLVISGGTNNFAYFGGGYAYASDVLSAGTTANVLGDTDITVKGGTTAFVFGGGYAFGTDAVTSTSQGKLIANVEGSTHIEITGGKITGGVFGGGYARGQYSTANVEGDTNIVISGGEFTSTALGPGVENSQGIYGGGYAGGGSFNGTITESATANVEGTAYITITGGDFNDVSIFGGGLADGPNATATVGNTVVYIDGATIDCEVLGTSYAGIYGGGHSVDAGSNATVTGDTSVIIDSATVTGNVYGGGYASYGTSNVEGTASITITDSIITGDVYGGGYTTYGTANVDTSYITISSGTIQGSVYGGGYVSEYYSTGVVTVGTSTITITGGTIEGSVYAFGYKNYDVQATTVIITGGIISGSVDGYTSAGNSILYLGTEDTPYSGTFEYVGDFNKIYISSGSNIIVTGNDDDITAYFDVDSTLRMNFSTSSLVSTLEGGIKVENDAILEITGVPMTDGEGTAVMENVTFGPIYGKYSPDFTSAWGYSTDGDVVDEDTIFAEYWTVESVSYDEDSYTYTATLSIDPDAVAAAMGAGTSSGAVSLAVRALANSALNTAASEFVLKSLNSGNGGTIIEGASQLGTVAAVLPGLSAINTGANANIGMRTSRAQITEASATSTWLAMNGDGAILPVADGDKMSQGFGIWFMPMYNHTKADGFSMASGDYGYDTDIFGASLGADYTFANNFRLGLAFNVGEGSSTSTGDYATTENDFDYYGLSVYGAKHFANVGLSFDMGYTVSENDMEQENDGGALYGDADASLFTLGLKAEYLVALDDVNVTPYAGLRFNYYNVDSFNTVQNGNALFSTASNDSTIWEFPVGVSFDTTTKVGSWDFTPSLALGVKFAAGDLDNDQSVSIAGVAGSSRVSGEVADNVTFQGGLGLTMTKDVCNISLSYTLDLSENVESHGIGVNLRYDF